MYKPKTKIIYLVPTTNRPRLGVSFRSLICQYKPSLELCESYVPFHTCVNVLKNVLRIVLLMSVKNESTFPFRLNIYFIEDIKRYKVYEHYFKQLLSLRKVNKYHGECARMLLKIIKNSNKLVMDVPIHLRRICVINLTFHR